MKDRVLLKQLPNLLTLLNMVLGLVVVLALVWRGPGYRLGACALILLAGGVDALDGKLARLWDVESDFGKQLDSFADLVSFGLAPVLLTLTHPEVRALGCPSYASLGLYVLAAAFRLARFNLGDFRDYFLGLPITAAGIILVLVNLLLHYSPILELGWGVAALSGLVLLLAALMASRVAVKRPW